MAGTAVFDDALEVFWGAKSKGSPISISRTRGVAPRTASSFREDLTRRLRWEWGRELVVGGGGVYMLVVIVMIG